MLKKVVYIGLLFTELWSCCFSSDYGYYLHEDECIEDPDFKGPNLHICLRNHEYEIVSKGYIMIMIILSWPPHESRETSVYITVINSNIIDFRYRRIPGDTCMPTGDSLFSDREQIDINKVCKSGDISLLQSQLKAQNTVRNSISKT